MADAVMQRYDTLAYYNGRTRAGWSYDVFLLGTAIDKLGNIDPKYSDYLKTSVDMLVDSSGQIERYDMEKYNIDLIRPATNLLTLAQRSDDPRYKKAIPQFVEQLEKHPKTHSGGYWHKQIYPWQIWLDGVYMGFPFLAARCLHAISLMSSRPSWEASGRSSPMHQTPPSGVPTSK